MRFLPYRKHIDLPQLVGFMNAIRTTFPKTVVIFVIQDTGHNVHFHPKQIAAAEAAGFQLIRAPWLNLVEKVGRKMRQEILHMHRQTDDWPHLKKRVCRFLDQYMLGSGDLLKFTGLFPV